MNIGELLLNHYEHYLGEYIGADTYNNGQQEIQLLGFPKAVENSMVFATFGLSKHSDMINNQCEIILAVDENYDECAEIFADSVDSLNSPGHQGIDGVYYKKDGHPQYIIAEAKYGSSRLGNTADGKQMSNNWIINRLDNALGDNTALSQAIKDEMILNPDNVGTNLYHISPGGAVDVTPLNNGVKKP